MKKFLLSIFAVLFAFAGAQAEEYTYTYTFSAKQFTANGTKTLGNVDWTLAGDGGYWGYDGTKGQQLGSSGKPYKSMTFSTSGISGTITKIVVNTSGANSIAATARVTVGGANFGEVKTLTNAATAYTFTGTASGDIVLSYTQTSSKAIYIKSISVTYTTGDSGEGEGGGATPEPVDVAEPTFTPASGTTFEGNLDVTINTEDGLIVSYSTDEKKTYTVGTSLNITETTTVYAYAKDADGNLSDIVSATYTKIVPIDPNAKEVEATISFASTTQRVSQDADKQVWANGGVTFTNNKASSSSNVANYSNPVRLYAGSNVVVEHEAMKKIVFVCNSTTYATYLVNSIGEAATVSGSDVTVTFINPVDEFTIEKLTKQVQLKSLTVTYLTTQKVVKTPVITPESCGFYAGENVEVTITAEEGTIYYTTDGNEPTTSSEVYSTSFTVSETTTVKAIAVVDGTASEVTTAVYTKGIEGSVADALAAYVDGEKLPAVVTGYIVGYVNGSTAGDAGENCVFDVAEEMKTNILIANDPYETDYMKCLAVQLPSNDIRTALNLVDNPDNLNKKVVIKGSLEKYLGIAAIKEIVIGELVEVPSYTLSVGETEWATLYLDAAVAIPDGVEIWTVSEIADGYVELGEVVDVIPANCPVLVKASMSGDYVFEYTNVAGDEYVNLLKGTTVNTYITEDAYVLTPDATSEAGVCFGKAIKNQLDGTAWLNNANKAYLPASVANGAASYSFRFGDGTTGIGEVKGESGNVKVIYDLTGRRVDNPSNGIYIINGVKVLVK